MQRLTDWTCIGNNHAVAVRNASPRDSEIVILSKQATSSNSLLLICLELNIAADLGVSVQSVDSKLNLNNHISTIKNNNTKR